MALLGSNAFSFGSGLSKYQTDRAAGTGGSGTDPSRGAGGRQVDSRSKLVRITPKPGAEGSLDYDRIAPQTLAWQHQVDKWIPYLATDNGPPERTILDPNATYVWKRHKPLDADKWCKGSLGDIFELPTEAHSYGRDPDGNTIHRLEIKIDHAHHYFTDRDHGPLHHIGPATWPAGAGIAIPVVMHFWRISQGGDDKWHWMAFAPVGGGPTPTPSPGEPSRPTKPSKPTQPTGRKPAGGGRKPGGPQGGGGPTTTPTPSVTPPAGGPGPPNPPTTTGGGGINPVTGRPYGAPSGWPGGGGGVGAGGGAGFPGPGPPGAPGATDLPGVGPTGPIPTGPRGLPFTPGGPTPTAGGNRPAGQPAPAGSGTSPDDPSGGSTSSSMFNAQQNFGASSASMNPRTNAAAFQTSRSTLPSRYLLGTPLVENLTHLPARPSGYLLGTPVPADPWTVPTPVTKLPGNTWTPTALTGATQTQRDFDNTPEQGSYMHHTNVLQDNAQLSRIAELDQRNRSEHVERDAVTIPPFTSTATLTTDFPVADGSLPVVNVTRTDGAPVPTGTATTGSYVPNADGTVTFVVFISPGAGASPVTVNVTASYPVDSSQSLPINPSVC